MRFASSVSITARVGFATHYFPSLSGYISATDLGGRREPTHWIGLYVSNQLGFGLVQLDEIDKVGDMHIRVGVELGFAWNRVMELVGLPLLIRHPFRLFAKVQINDLDVALDFHHVVHALREPNDLAIAIGDSRRH